jgi:transglutaminase-like putative cysteine protease
MSPGSLNNLIQSGEIAFRVQFSGEVPKKNQLYWRGPVLADYDGQTWRARQFFPRANNNAQIQPDIEARGTTVRYTMTIEPHNRRWLLALDLPVSLPESSTITPHFEARSREPITQRTRITLASVVDFTVNRQENKALVQQALQLPPKLNPRTRILSASWRDELKTPERISDAALRLFRQEQFFYTLQPPLLGENSIDDFLFETRRGFCEHFAAAYVVLMRAAGVPARVVAGYQGGEFNPVDGYFTVRQSDAHAWAEIWIAGKGWLRVDPTAAVAPTRIEQGIVAALPAGDPLPTLVRLDADWLRKLHFRWEAINNAWNQWVLEYNPQRQREVLSRLGFDEPDWRKMTAALAMLCGTSLLIVTLWALFQPRRQTPAQRLWQHYCRQLKRRGIERFPWEGPIAFAERIAPEHPELGELTHRAADHYAALHYGRGEADQLEKLKTCLRQLEQWQQ